jgi:hypothetical protein
VLNGRSDHIPFWWLTSPMVFTKGTLGSADKPPPGVGKYWAIPPKKTAAYAWVKLSYNPKEAQWYWFNRWEKPDGVQTESPFQATPLV